MELEMSNPCPSIAYTAQPTCKSAAAQHGADSWLQRWARPLCLPVHTVQHANARLSVFYADVSEQNGKLHSCAGYRFSDLGNFRTVAHVQLYVR